MSVMYVYAGLYPTPFGGVELHHWENIPPPRVCVTFTLLEEWTQTITVNVSHDYKANNRYVYEQENAGNAFSADPAGGAYSARPDPLAGFRGPTSKGGGMAAYF